MNKPKWEHAPDWANWLCKYHGEWYWSEYNRLGHGGDVYYGKTQFIKEYETGVSEFPESRP